jgi:hypothetical protein
MGMESCAVQVPVARTTWLHVVDHLDDHGSRLCRAKEPASVVRIESIQIPRHGIEPTLIDRRLDEYL